MSRLIRLLYGDVTQQAEYEAFNFDAASSSLTIPTKIQRVFTLGGVSLTVKPRIVAPKSLIQLQYLAPLDRIFNPFYVEPYYLHEKHS